MLNQKQKKLEGDLETGSQVKIIKKNELEQQEKNKGHFYGIF